MKSILTFLFTQVVSIAVLYFVQGYIFAQFPGMAAWIIYAIMVAFYVAYFIYDIVLLLRKRKLVKNFNW